jgi:hypothetical protein
MPLQSTVAALNFAHKRYRALDTIRSFYSVPVSKGTLSRIMRNEPVSLKAENKVRIALGMLPRTYEIEACPSCGTDHNLAHIPDCHGSPVAAVVTLAPDEEVRKIKAPTRKQKRKAYLRPCLSLEPRERLQQLWDLVEQTENIILGTGEEL